MSQEYTVSLARIKCVQHPYVTFWRVVHTFAHGLNYLDGSHKTGLLQRFPLNEGMEIVVSLIFIRFDFYMFILLLLITTYVYVICFVDFV